MLGTSQPSYTPYRAAAPALTWVRCLEQASHSTVNRNAKYEVCSIEAARLEQLMEMERSLAAVDNMHKHVDGLRSRANQLRVDAHNRKTHVRSVNFGVGDFVLRGVLARKRERKTSLRWTGPFEVVSCESNCILLCEISERAPHRPCTGLASSFSETPPSRSRTT
jgi:hypothetical protein